MSFTKKLKKSGLKHYGSELFFPDSTLFCALMRDTLASAWNYFVKFPSIHFRNPNSLVQSAFRSFLAHTLDSGKTFDIKFIDNYFCIKHSNYEPFTWETRRNTIIDEKLRNLLSWILCCSFFFPKKTCRSTSSHWVTFAGQGLLSATTGDTSAKKYYCATLNWTLKSFYPRQSILLCWKY